MEFRVTITISCCSSSHLNPYSQWWWCLAEKQITVIKSTSLSTARVKVRITKVKLQMYLLRLFLLQWSPKFLHDVVSLFTVRPHSSFDRQIFNHDSVGAPKILLYSVFNWRLSASSSWTLPSNSSLSFMRPHPPDTYSLQCRELEAGFYEGEKDC